ncbi:MAG TPA: NAD(P)H-dependent oxidoreductase subunit E [Polyangia bacterium]|nr:NAD(P)H-dependent oxidoreductase subunit E [Polyangia bacterium]
MDTAKIDGILARWNRDPDYLIEILQDVQDAWRHLPEPVLRQVADALVVPLARVHHAATFYQAFSLEPRGLHQVQVCLGTACHVKGAPRVLDAIGRELGVTAGKTTADGQYTVEAVRCVGACGLAPVVALDGEYHGDLTPDNAARLMVRHRKEGAK